MTKLVTVPGRKLCKILEKLGFEKNSPKRQPYQV